MKKKPKLIFIIDGNFFAWRAYKTRNLSTSSGRQTSVISGMLQMIKGLHEEFRYNRLVICWDPPDGSQFRKKLFPEYKANRKESREKNQSLFEQIADARRFFEALNVRQAILPGIEGDDVMALVAFGYADKGHRTIICSADRDLLQLIRPGVKIYRPNTKQLVGRKEFADMYSGLKPSDLVKIKSIMGDKGDNIPGIPGIGEKGAIEIVKSFRTIEQIMTRRTINKKVILVRKHIKQVELAYNLVKILRVPEELPKKQRRMFLSTMKSFRGCRTIDWMKLKKEFHRLELRHRNFNAIAEQLTLVYE